MAKIITVELNEKQQSLFEDWCTHLRAIYGEVGLLTWCITPTGIGEEITVTSAHAPGHPFDLTDIDSW